MPTPAASPAPAAATLDRGLLLGRAAEALILFVGLPLLVRSGLVPLPRLVLLGLVCAAAGAALLRDPAFQADGRWFRGLRAEAGGVVLRSAAAALVILLLVRWLAPDRLLALPREAPLTWLLGLALYPLLSAWPQELLYRTWFFHRYAPLFPGPRALVAASGVAFALLHLVYPNLVAPLLSLPAGLILAWRYQRHGRLGPVWVEHAAYGLLLFSLGLGDFFYDGRG